MPRKRMKYVQIERSRHGRVVYYFRRGGARVRIVLPKDNPARLAISIAIRRSLKGAKVRAASRTMQFDITEDWVLKQIDAQDCRCALTRIPFFMKHEAASKVNPYAPSIDRIDSRQGYTRDNVRIVIFAINMMMLDWGDAVFERVVNSYRAAKPYRERGAPIGLTACRTRPARVGGAHG